MANFFHGWRRKFGVVTLVLACVFAAGWLSTIRSPNCVHFVWQTSDKTAFRFGTRNSQLVINSIDASLSLYVSSGINQAIAVWKDPTTSTLNYPSQADNEIHWVFRFGGFDVGEYSQEDPFEFHFKTWRFPYWSIVIPLTLLSAYLLLSKPRSPHPKNVVETVTAEGA